MEITIRCQWCGQPLRTRDLRRKYHKVNQDGVFCAREARLEQKRECERERRRKGYTKPKKGTGLLGPTPHEDIKKEVKEIGTEQVYLRIRTKDTKITFEPILLNTKE